MSRSVKCPVKGCPGVASIETDGRGGTRDVCPCCVKREAWKAANLPDAAKKVPCRICGGTIVTRGKYAKYCAPCRQLHHRASSRRSHARAKHAATVLPLRSA